MKVCPKCNAQLVDDAVFCTGCGQKIEEGTAAQAANVCQKCGSPLSSDTQFCTKCGTSISGVSKSSNQAAAPTQPKTSRVSVEPGGSPKSSGKNPALLIGGVLIIVAVIGFFFFNSSGSGGVPKTPEDFVSAYNREIKDIAKENKVNANLISLEDVPSELNELVGMMQAGGNEGSAGGKIVIKTAGNGTIVFAGTKMKDQSLQLMFQIQNALDSKAFFAAMEGFIKASGGEVGAVMKGLGLLSGQRYNLPADYAKEFVYNNNLSYKVVSMGGHMTQLTVEVGNGGNSKPSASTAATNEPQKQQQSVQPQSQSETNLPQKPEREAVSEPVLANIALGDSYSTVRQVLGSPSKEETKPNGEKCYYFPSVEVHCRNGKVTMLISSSSEATTPKGIHEGSTYRAMLKAYGKGWKRSTYGDLDLYEYTIDAQDGRAAILRFAINNTMDTKVRERVDYISIRYQE